VYERTFWMKQYFLGVDIGGTKSHALIADEEGNALGFGETGPGNHEVVGYRGLKKALTIITSQALGVASIRRNQIAGAGFGVAGYDWPSELAPTLEAIQTLKLKARLSAVNDTIVGLLAGASQGWGIAVVAGTGENCWGWDVNRRVGRVTGNGYGENGSAWTLVYKSVEAIAHQWTLRGPATALTPAFIKLTGAKDISDFLEGLALERYHLDPRAAPLVFQVASQGDEIAQGIIHWTGQELGQLALCVARQLEFQKINFEVVLVGSLYEIGSMLIDPMRETIHTEAPGARLVRLAAPPVIGGVLLGMEQVGLEAWKVRERLIESTNHLLSEVE
jgi:N-acetylglucosamine kinase-like BadF-type ATPase